MEDNNMEMEELKNKYSFFRWVDGENKTLH